VERLLAKFEEDGHVANGQKTWLVEMAKSTATPFKTMQNWWHAFSQETGLALKRCLRK
jgi:hypothetical protein